MYGMATKQSIMAVMRAARPQFRTVFDKVAFAVHAAFFAAGYVLHATGTAAFIDDAFSISSEDEVGMDNWNDVEDNYAFVYSNPEKDSSKKVLVKCLVMNDKLLVDVLEEGGYELLHLELNTGEYVQDKDNGGTNYGSQFKNLGKFVDNVNKQILYKLDCSDIFLGPSRGDPWFFRGSTREAFPVDLPGARNFDTYRPPNAPGFERKRYGYLHNLRLSEKNASERVD